MTAALRGMFVLGAALGPGLPPKPQPQLPTIEQTEAGASEDGQE